MELDDRKLLILRTIIDDYIMTAMPIGSRAISKHPGIRFSSATIRNEMSDLEEMGYLDQPHTSAGRIPSDKAYRLYVDSLMQRANLTKQEVDLIRMHVSRRIEEAENLITQAAEVLSALTHYPSIVMAPKLRRVKIKHMQLVPITDGKALAVIVTDSGTVHNTPMRVPTGYGATELEGFSRMLTTSLAGQTPDEAIIMLQNTLGPELGEHRQFFDQLADALADDLKRPNEKRIALGGATSIFQHPEFSDIRRAQEMLSMLETKQTLYNILDRATMLRFTVTIGQENEEEAVKDTSIVTATYRIGDTPIGSFGVIGPTRMHYARVTAVLECMARSLSEIFTNAQDDSGDSS